MTCLMELWAWTIYGYGLSMGYLWVWTIYLRLEPFGHFKIELLDVVLLFLAKFRLDYLKRFHEDGIQIGQIKG